VREGVRRCHEGQQWTDDELYSPSHPVYGSLVGTPCVA
jgi:hypothetical protein